MVATWSLRNKIQQQNTRDPTCTRSSYYREVRACHLYYSLKLPEKKAKMFKWRSQKE